ncbi:MAG: type II toxin-antitoxin system PemK/MazF family toxin [Alphaproteobacteria bacterium]|nr:type II toxin-antitoxin system PemK/MazF family toxin [Alphaproteobacteria bacterium]
MPKALLAEPTSQNGLKKPSQVMIDKAQTIPRERAGTTFGRLDNATMLTITRALAVWFGFA